MLFCVVQSKINSVGLRLYMLVMHCVQWLCAVNVQAEV